MHAAATPAPARRLTRVSEEEVERVLRMCDEHPDWSQRRLAAETRISRTSVARILRGELTGRRAASDAVQEFFPASGGYLRCATCGGKVIKPCLLCHVRAQR